MDSNPYMLIMWEDGKDYNTWPMASSILDSLNTVPEIWNIIWDGANKAKLQLTFDIYNYFWWTKKATYKWLIEYLNKNTSY